eukprot:scaffold264466_cov18-Tisochrysis_lutea.AAC.1
MICSWLQDKVGAIRFSDLLRCLYPEASTLDLRLLARMARPDVSVLGCASLCWYGSSFASHHNPACVPVHLHATACAWRCTLLATTMSNTRIGCIKKPMLSLEP